MQWLIHLLSVLCAAAQFRFPYGVLCGNICIIFGGFSGLAESACDMCMLNFIKTHKNKIESENKEAIPFHSELLYYEHRGVYNVYR